MHRLRCRKRPSTWPGRSTELSIGCQSRITLVRCQGTKSLADDLITGQGVVSSRAASILRSVETYPLIGRFVSPLGNQTTVLYLVRGAPQAAVPPNRRRRRLSGDSSRRVDSTDTPPYRRAALVAQFVTKERELTLFLGVATKESDRPARTP